MRTYTFDRDAVRRISHSVRKLEQQVSGLRSRIRDRRRHEQDPAVLVMQAPDTGIAALDTQNNAPQFALCAVRYIKTAPTGDTVALAPGSSLPGDGGYTEVVWNWSTQAVAPLAYILCAKDTYSGEWVVVEQIVPGSTVRRRVLRDFAGQGLVDWFPLDTEVPLADWNIAGASFLEPLGAPDPQSRYDEFSFTESAYYTFAFHCNVLVDVNSNNQSPKIFWELYFNGAPATDFYCGWGIGSVNQSSGGILQTMAHRTTLGVFSGATFGLRMRFVDAGNCQIRWVDTQVEVTRFKDPDF